jgi:hypothetical protein
MTCAILPFRTTPETFTRVSAIEDTGPFARFDAAKKGLLSAGNDWPAMLGYAQTLSESPRWTDTELARHTRQAHALHLRNEAQLAAETPADVARSFAHRWQEVLIGGAFGAVVLLAVTGWIS